MLDIIQDRLLKNDLLIWDFINLDRELANKISDAYFHCNWQYSDIPQKNQSDVADIVINMLVRTDKQKDFYWNYTFQNDEDEIWYLQELYIKRNNSLNPNYSLWKNE